jgi:hypothetical protein
VCSRLAPVRHSHSVALSPHHPPPRRSACVCVSFPIRLRRRASWCIHVGRDATRAVGAMDQSHSAACDHHHTQPAYAVPAQRTHATEASGWVVENHSQRESGEFGISGHGGPAPQLRSLQPGAPRSSFDTYFAMMHRAYFWLRCARAGDGVALRRGPGLVGTAWLCTARGSYVPAGCSCSRAGRCADEETAGRTL